MFLLVPAYPGCPGSKAVKRSLLLLYLYMLQLCINMFLSLAVLTAALINLCIAFSHCWRNLRRLSCILLAAIALNDVDDVRPVLEFYSQFDDPVAAFRQKQQQLQVMHYSSVSFLQLSYLNF